MKGTVWSAFGECVIAAAFLAYGLTRKPLHLNEFNPVKKPVSVLAARLVYLPLGVLFLLFGIRDFVRALH